MLRKSMQIKLRKSVQLFALSAVATTVVVLGPTVATPPLLLLDYMYLRTTSKLDISTESAIGSRHLAQLFGMRLLHSQVMKFIISNMSTWMRL